MVATTIAKNTALITNDASVLGLLVLTLGLIFFTEKSKHPFFKKFYKFVPALLLCYFIPGLFNTFNIISGEESKLYFVASRYLLPSCLVLLTLSVDLRGVFNLGPKAIILFLTGTVGIILGGPLAILVTKYFFSDAFGAMAADDVWRGMTTVAGSWIGGGANQAAMKEVFEVPGKVFSVMVVVDILVASAWLAVLLFLSDRAEAIDKKSGADTSGITALKEKMEKFQKSVTKVPTSADLIFIIAVAFTATGISHMFADFIAPFIKMHAPYLSKFSLTSKFFWLIVTATTIGIALSFTRLKNLEGVGASKIGNVFLYILIATIGMHMNVIEIFDNPGLFLVGIIWMSFHGGLMLLVGRLIKAPLFFIAVGSQANVGGAASAPVVASVFHPTLAPVGVLLAVLGYILGTYGAWLCGHLMRMVS